MMVAFFPLAMQQAFHMLRSVAHLPCHFHMAVYQLARLPQCEFNPPVCKGVPPSNGFSGPRRVEGVGFSGKRCKCSKMFQERCFRSPRPEPTEKPSQKPAQKPAQKQKPEESSQKLQEPAQKPEESAQKPKESAQRREARGEAPERCSEGRGCDVKAGCKSVS